MKRRVGSAAVQQIMTRAILSDGGEQSCHAEAALSGHFYPSEDLSRCPSKKMQLPSVGENNLGESAFKGFNLVGIGETALERI